MSDFSRGFPWEVYGVFHGRSTRFSIEGLRGFPWEVYGVFHGRFTGFSMGGLRGVAVSSPWSCLLLLALFALIAAVVVAGSLFVFFLPTALSRQPSRVIILVIISIIIMNCPASIVQHPIYRIQWHNKVA